MGSSAGGEGRREVGGFVGRWVDGWVGGWEGGGVEEQMIFFFL